MRQAINENPVVQLSLLGVLLIVVGFMLVTRVMKKDPAAETPATTGASAATGVVPGAPGATTAGSAAPTTSPSTAPATGSAATAAVPGASATAGAAPAPTSSGTVSPEALVPGPGLPRPVVSAWRHGEAVVLLIVRGGATDDKLVRQSVEALSRPGISTFVTRAKGIARYSRITQGVGVNQVPALVVIRPSRVSGKSPQASLSYGFRNSQSVVQAVQDALYKGRDDLPYSPG